MFKAWAQLVRLPNVFTAPADVLAGAGFVLLGFHGAWPWPIVQTVILLCAASICFYAAGMVLNDVFDYEEDKQERPFRPLPSGRINRTLALAVGILLLSTGVGLALLKMPSNLWWPHSLPIFLLPVLILGYNVALKHTFLGPLTMGLCRGLNLLLGATVIPLFIPAAWWAAFTVTFYITGVTIIAHDETKQGNRLNMKFGIGLIVLSVLSVSSMIVACMINSDSLHPKTIIPLFIGWLALIASELVPAYRDPSPQNVGNAVKYCIFGLIILETIHLTLTVGLPGYLLLLLLFPANYLGRFIYST
ncbi:MAG TPA: UbiA family prenyltransferase [Gemmatales bacterium]|nr:UbiA family prenyltransferase [Gemmatales bacterium]